MFVGKQTILYYQKISAAEYQSIKIWEKKKQRINNKKKVMIIYDPFMST